ncbi:Coenzyme F420-dependent N5,N10-methylene tetrahydromethanopterin reductase or related flavin-dependent oxidoreductase [Halalkaliarchaeum sp. AArc-CO]|uniref:TIGR04024 family LLM class F420-dependent oxidoreductase n=1 Tax=unclassified Halalkaliarchaeum TaxID=2678344 RepID=UPI00217DC5CB|nr:MULTISPECIES: TIGR04024 family LLM class F420-dependent oxidoreductase [unclassified Halalkaliarchaeum]MDR5671989.1 TIGR04024 family LLM class F420-dependent oxidoreductase [Halalkaliarchaeum sp. AArc-GB]UWG51494.1 Coenzyme F420-dependent N5,N10-methylene tetrahydromethanopterin reductase or related flavin-dependent oxidoreductase [Halalkaliarchaeum sp. AArc-CO]
MDAARDLSLPVAAQPSLEAIVSMVERAEDAGYDRVWLPETWGRDAVTTLSVAAERTDEIGLGTSITNVYSRSPALVGQTAATLHEASDGRFRVGLGPSGPAVIQNWHGQSFERPLRRTREYVEIVRAVCAGEELDYDGELFDLSGFRLRFDPPEPAPPVDAAGLGPKSVELAGRFADGWHALLLTPDGLADRLEDLRRGVELGGRDVDSVRVTLSVTCCALPDPEPARDLVRQHLAFYVGGMGTFYRDALARQGYEETATRIHDAWQEGNRRAALSAIDDDLLEELAAAGTPEAVASRVAEFEALEGVDAVTVSFPRGADRDAIDATLEALSP